MSHSVVSESLLPHGPYSPWNSPGQNTGVGSLSLLQGSSQPRDRTQVSCIASRFCTSSFEPPGKPTNTGVGSLSLLQWGSPTLQVDSLSAELLGKPMEACVLPERNGK